MSSVSLSCDHAIWTVGAAVCGATVALIDDRVNPQIGAACGACFYVTEQVGKSLLNYFFTINQETDPVLSQRVKLCFGFAAAGTVMNLMGYSWRVGVDLSLGLLGIKSVIESCLKPNRTTLDIHKS